MSQTWDSSVTIRVVEPVVVDRDSHVIHVMEDGAETPGLPAGFLEWCGHPGPILHRHILDKLGRRIEVITSMGNSAPYARVRNPYDSSEIAVGSLEALLNELRRRSREFDSVIVGVGKAISDQQVEASDAVCEFARHENKTVMEIHSRSLGSPVHHAKIRVMRQSRPAHRSFSGND